MTLSRRTLLKLGLSAGAAAKPLPLHRVRLTGGPL